MGSGFRCTALLPLFSACVLILVASGDEKEKPRSLYEISSENVDVGMEPFYEGNMEPFGVVCVGHVVADSPNHKLLKELAAITKQSDEVLFDLQIPMAAALDWQEKETLQIVRRTYAARLWEAVEQPPLDMDPIFFPGNGKPWKKKQVRQWLLDNGWATVNYRVPGFRGKKEKFPFWKYFGKGNEGGVGLIVVKMKDLDDFGPQFRAARALRQHIDKLSKKKIRFAVMEKLKASREMREVLKMGLDDDIESELYLIEDAGKQDKVDNHWHGNPKKYRLQNFTEEAVSSFFDAYYAGKLPTFWASLQEVDKSYKYRDLQLKGTDFEDKVFGAAKEVGLLVAFFNDDPADGCKQCVHARKVWDDVAKEVAGTRSLQNIVIASLDQSTNEHPEKIVANKLGQAVVVWYPPGKPDHRRKRRQVLHAFSEQFSFEPIMTKVKDIAFDIAEEGEEL